MTNVVISRPDFERAVLYGSYWLYKVVKYYKEKGFHVFDLYGGYANRDVWAVRTKQSRLCTGVGHGNADVFTGQNYDILWRTCQYEKSEVQGKIVFLLSCLTARRLGKDIIDKGGQCYIGWYEEYIFMVSKGPSDDDPYQQAFLKPISDALNLLADGKKTGEVVNWLYNRYTELIKEWENIDPEAAHYLKHDRDSLRIYGDEEAQVTKPGEPPQPPQPDVYICPWCGYITENAEKMKKHILEMHCPHEEFWYECCFCSYKTKSKCDLANHYYEEHPRYFCPWCSYETPSPRELRYHIKTEHADEICPPCPPPKYKCIFCGAEFDSCEELCHHVHDEHPTYVCPFCRQLFDDLEKLKKHIEEKHFPETCPYYDSVNKTCRMKPCHFRKWIRKILKCPLAVIWNK